jgi:hypothetical protein
MTVGRKRRLRTLAAAALAVALVASAAAAQAPATVTLSVRGQEQTLRTYGARGGPVAIVASGDGGWVHLGPYVAEYLSSKGWYVLGFDSKAYLSGFTTRRSTLNPTDVPGDFMVLVDHAAKGAPGPPVLIGVSEGAGLAVLAAADPAVKKTLAGVVGLGLPETCELGWRWKDSLIYLTKGVPREPTFDTSEIIGKVAPLPVVAIHSTRDEFVTVDEVKRVMSKAGPPSQLWFVEAQNHRFSGNTAEFEKKLLEALEWIKEHPR